MEIADTSLRYDLGIKAKLYSRIGIIEYWVVDVAGRKLYCHRIPTTNGYSEIRIYGESEMISIEAHPEYSVIVSELLIPETID